MEKKVAFVLAIAFSKHPFGGNPAAVVFTELTHPEDFYKGIAKNLSQPMIAFVKAKTANPPDGSPIATFGIRFFTPYDQEIPLCGHATLAAAKVIFENQHCFPPEINILEFEVGTGKLSARKLHDGSLEIRFPSCVPEEVSDEEKAKVTISINKAFNRMVDIRYIGKGGRNGHYNNCEAHPLPETSFEQTCYGADVMVEVAAQEDLKNSVVNTEALVSSWELHVFKFTTSLQRDTGYEVQVITSASISGDELFVSRMFCHGYVAGGEDQVCGSAHCLIGPYWYRKYGIRVGEEVKATQVSPRGGELKLVWLEDEETVVLRGMSTVIGRGEMYV
ncbi:hypothetical protein AX15_004044 [Amanita polypyramis BW_CC]|nr:hypothetical protein AX15_004044 [Amanita polypyramis BW_CC]